jgi:hypothetical protein
MPASIPKTTRVIINANPPVGEIKPDTFKVEERPLPELQEGQVLVKILALGNEPAQRNWLDTSIDEVSAGPAGGFARLPPIPIPGGAQQAVAEPSLGRDTTLEIC